MSGQKSAYFMHHFCMQVCKITVMKKLMLAAIIPMMAISCEKKVEATDDTPSANVTEPATAQAQKNEMVAAMDEMMNDMHDTKFSGNNDRDFAEMMADHHEGAVEMSEILLQKGTDSGLKDFAKKVIADQNKEIAVLDRFDDFSAVSPDHEAFQKDLQRSMAAMMDKNIKIHNNTDKDYAQQMIPHHQSAVEMAEVYLKYGKNAELLALCKNVVSAQTEEIAYLQNWLSRK